MHAAEEISCTSRIPSDPESWKRDDPQIPQSIWWNTNAHFDGFRIVRPAEQPTQEEMGLFWEQTLDQFYYEYHELFIRARTFSESCPGLSDIVKTALA